MGSHIELVHKEGHSGGHHVLHIRQQLQGQAIAVPAERADRRTSLRRLAGQRAESMSFGDLAVVGTARYPHLAISQGRLSVRARVFVSGSVSSVEFV